MKRKMKRLIGLFAVAALVCALATTAFALNIDAGTINKTVGESGVYYRLPRLTDTCVCDNVLREFIPDADDYTNMRYTVSGDGVSDVQMSVGTWPSGEYAGYPCMKVTYKVVKASNTTVITCPSTTATMSAVRSAIATVAPGGYPAPPIAIPIPIPSPLR